MNPSSSDVAAASEGSSAAAEVSPASRPNSTTLSLTTLAWVTTLLISRLPEIVLREVFAISVPWMPWAVVALTVGLWVAARYVAALRPLERYFAVMAVLAVMFAVIPAIFSSAAWQSVISPGGHPMVVLLAERILLALLAVVMVGFLMLLGTRPKDAYIVKGDLNAPNTSRKPGSTELLRWGVFGPIMFVFLAGLTAWVAVAPMLPDQIDLGAALPYLVVAAIAALLNAFWEEVAYRAAPLSQLGRAIAPSMGVVILAVWFGLGHFYGGIPSGAMGAVVTALGGLLFGRAMIETHGLGWPLALHFSGDMVVYSLLALAATAPAA